MADAAPEPRADRRSDMPRRGWVAAAPAVARPYLRLSRLDRPIGYWLLLFPGWQALALAHARPLGWTFVADAALFFVGAVVMRGAGCAYNDIVDRKFDAQVARTASRPIPAGEVNVRQALIWLAAQCALGLMVLALFNPFAIAVGAASLALIVVYPFMKRVTWWPQAFLGLTFSWGALLGWAAARATLEWPALALYAGGVLWTIGYDTIYAHQDKDDDALIGVRSTARLFGSATRALVAAFYAGATALFAAAGWLAGAGWPWYAGLAVAAALLAIQAATVRIDDPDHCLAMFKVNRWVGWALFVGALADGLIAAG